MKNFLCPRCGGNLFIEEETDGEKVVVCINGHRFEKKLPPIMPSGPSQPSYAEEIAMRRESIARRNQAIIDMAGDGYSIEKLGEIYKLRPGTVNNICLRGHS